MDAHRLRAQLPIINTTVVETHVEDAAILAANRFGVVNEPHRDLESLADADERLLAHLDGVQLAGLSGRNMAAAAFVEAPELGEVFVFMWTHFRITQIDGEAPDALRHILVDSRDGEGIFQALIAAFAWHDHEPPAWLISLLPTTLIRRVHLALAAQRGRPEVVLVSDCWAETPTTVLKPAMHAAACLGRVDLVDNIRPHLRYDDIDVRFHAAWALALLAADAGALTLLRSFATAKHPSRERATIMAARRSAPSDALPWIAELSMQPAYLRTALMAAGAHGDPSNLPWIIAQMNNPTVARVAGEAFSMITGADLAYLDLDADQPADFTPPGPTDDPNDPTVDTDPDEHLPWPNAELITTWLNTHRSEFTDGTRHLCGKPISVTHCQHVLRHGYQRQRAAAALELAFLQPGQPLFDITAPARRQHERLAART
jgi:uncharacterized protein (TIGR02270 family)